ncbi:hypothetical protein F4859DRAFT_493029 [Xylaria cf. heliscus]|nr:hypothetical protein F4859DRAFT_493029 [Xylaria cf. heliscus]
MANQPPLPSNPRNWNNESQFLEWKSIHQYGLACSGSEISREQFLLLRTLWVEHDAKQLYGRDRSIWIDESKFREAQQFLCSGAVAPAWEQFLKSTSTEVELLEQSGYAGLHTFSLVKYHQAQSGTLTSEENDSAKVDMSPIAKRTRNKLKQRVDGQSSPTPAPKLADIDQKMGGINMGDVSPDRLPTTPDRGGSRAPYRTPEDASSPFEDPRMFKAIQDEQIVNTALIEYLNALAIHCIQLEANWTLHRLPLIARDHRGAKTYEARVDGYLKRRLDDYPLVIIEVKPFSRNRKKTAIRMQESAQMAAWINQYRPPNMSELRGSKRKIKRLLISQDRHLIYLNFAVFDASYVDYICNSPGIDLDDASFLVMNEYGPFSIRSPPDMSMLGELVLGYTLTKQP